MDNFPFGAFLLASVASFLMRGLIFSPKCLGTVWAKGAFPQGMPQDAQMGPALMLLVFAASLWQGFTAVVLVSLIGISWKLLLVVVLFAGSIKFAGLETIGFARRSKKAVFVELTSTLVGFMAALAVCVLMIK